MKQITCKNCGQSKFHKAKGLCAACYQAQYRRTIRPMSPVEIRDEARDEIVRFIDSSLRPYGGSCRYDGAEVVLKINDKTYRQEFTK